MTSCPFCGAVGSYTEECSPGLFRNICGACDAFGPPAKTAAGARARFAWRPVHATYELPATEVAAKAASARTRKEYAHLRDQAALRHARAIIDLYDGGVR